MLVRVDAITVSRCVHLRVAKKGVTKELGNCYNARTMPYELVPDNMKVSTSDGFQRNF